MDFAIALGHLWAGKGCYRMAWAAGVQIKLMPPVKRYSPAGNPVTIQPVIEMHHPNGLIDAWAPRHTDLLAYDWAVEK